MIDAKCFQGYKPGKKENKDSEKNKPANNTFVDIPDRKQIS